MAAERDPHGIVPDGFYEQFDSVREADAGDGAGADGDADERDVDRALRHPGDAGDDAGPREVRRANHAMAVDEAEAGEREADIEDGEPKRVGDARH